MQYNLFDISFQSALIIFPIYNNIGTNRNCFQFNRYNLDSISVVKAYNNQPKAYKE